MSVSGVIDRSAGLACALRTGVDALLAADLTGLTDLDVAGLLRDVEVQRRRLDAVDARLIAQAQSRAVAHAYGRTSTTDLLVGMLRVSPGEARARVARAEDLAPRVALSGEVLTPLLPVASDALLDGQISAGHIAVITQCLAIPSCLPDEATAVAEGMLVEAARHEQPRQLARTATMLLARIDPDGVAPRDRDMERQRSFTLLMHADGSSTPRGRIAPDVTAGLNAYFDAAAAPVPAVDGMPDDRTPGQRRHDALGELAMRVLRSGTLPPAGGSPVTILARTTMSDLQAGVGVAVTGHGDPISVATVLKMAGEAEVIPVVLSDSGGVLAYGRTRRLASRGQRLALAARDGGCCFPGCDRPAAWTEVHHVRSWLPTGDTDLDNMCLLCRYHHRTFANYGWDVLMIDDVPHWRPPPWIDRQRRPIRNTAHHLDDIEFSDEPNRSGSSDSSGRNFDLPNFAGTPS